MTFVLISHGLYGGAVQRGGVKYTGFVKSYDPDASPNVYPTGVATFTDEPRSALTFKRPEDALAFMNQVSATVPLRPDGKPNRPIRAFTLEVARIELPS